MLDRSNLSLTSVTMASVASQPLDVESYLKTPCIVGSKKLWTAITSNIAINQSRQIS